VRTIAASLAALALLSATNVEAAGGTYEVVFCSSANRSFGGEIDTTNAFTARSLCSDPAEGNAIKIDNVARTTAGRNARVSWRVEPPLAIVGVSVEGRLRRANGYASWLFMTDAEGRYTHEVASGGRDPSDFETFEWEGPKPQQGFTASLECTETPSCEASTQAHTWLRNLRFTVADSRDPEIDVSGSLFDAGWVRGDVSAIVSGVDPGAGMKALTMTSNGEPFVAETSDCAGELPLGLASTFRPCPPTAFFQAQIPSAEAPFANGVNEIRSCAEDFATNEACAISEIRIDNEAPVPAFAASNPDDPELIRVPVEDGFSGLAGGTISFRAQGGTEWRPLPTQVLPSELHARVDSASEESGTYEFMATATDIAGNASQTTFREDGTPMILEFPLRAGVQLNARIEPGGAERVTLPYGRHARAEGRLLDAAGLALADRPVIVTEDLGEGALFDERVRTVTTDDTGRWSSKLPSGPSRHVFVSYEGDQRYLAQEVDAGSLAIRTGVKLGLSRKRVSEGSSTTFRGRIERLGARIPRRGKLLQLQYQEPTSGRWFTVRNPFHSRSDGKFSFKYEFGTHYTTDVAIRFRLKVPPERGWPYQGARTRPERVIVEARP